jgi:aminopeptidase N
LKGSFIGPTDTPQTIYLKDFTAPAFLIDTVDPDFVIESIATARQEGNRLELRTVEGALAVTLVREGRE